MIEAETIDALMSPGLEAEALDDLIEREEDWLANDAEVGIGELEGVRTQTIWVQPGDADPLLLRRPTDTNGGQGSGHSLEVRDGGVLRDDVELTGPARIEAVGGAWTGPKVEVTYAPTDGPRVRRVLIELIRISISASPFQQEATEGRSYSRPKSMDAQRAQLARTLNPHRGIRTTRLPTGATHRITSS